MLLQAFHSRMYVRVLDHHTSLHFHSSSVSISTVRCFVSMSYDPLGSGGRKENFPRKEHKDEDSDHETLSKHKVPNKENSH